MSETCEENNKVQPTPYKKGAADGTALDDDEADVHGTEVVDGTTDGQRQPSPPGAGAVISNIKELCNGERRKFQDFSYNVLNCDSVPPLPVR